MLTENRQVIIQTGNRLHYLATLALTRKTKKMSFENRPQLFQRIAGKLAT